MVSDADIVRRLTSVLRNADFSTITTAAIRRQLEKDLGVDLTDRKAFIREQVDLYLKEQQAEAEEAEQIQDDGPGAEGEGEVEQEEEEEGDEEEAEEEDQEQRSPDEECEDSKPARKSKQSNHEPDSKRFKAKIDRVIKATSIPKEKKKRAGGAGGLNKVCGLSPELQALIGEAELPRTQVVKLLWVYIRENELQDPDNRRKIVCNDELRGLFGVDSTDIFKMNRLLSKHIWPLDKPVDGEPKAKATGEPKPKKPKTEKKENEKSKSEKDTERHKTEKKDRGRSAPALPLSEELIEFLGTDETEMAQTDVVRCIWDYIAKKKLQDPADKRTIFCDEKLQALFQCDTFVGFNLTKLLAPHLKG